MKRKKNDGTNDLIQRYLKGNLSNKERLDFEEVIKRDPFLNEDILLYWKLSNVISDSELEVFKKKLEKIHAKHFTPPITTKFVINKKLYYAAAIILIFISIGFCLLKPQKLDGQSLFVEFYKPLSEISVSRSVEDKDGIILLKDAIDYYNNKNYVAASKLFKKIVLNNKKNHIAKLYLGLCGIELDSLKFAKEHLKSLLNANEMFFSEKAEWYLAMVYLKEEKVNDAKVFLKAIVKRKGEYSKTAKLILDKI
jgi:tetratricopeptide (TPR) repeat protein